MGFRFNKRLKIAPGIRLNFGLGGISATVGILGSGLSYSTKMRIDKGQFVPITAL